MYEERLRNQIEEFKNAIGEDPTLENIAEHIECLGHCPGYKNYRTWLFKYKDIVIILNDDGNSFYSYFGCVNDLIDSCLEGSEVFGLGESSVDNAIMLSYARKTSLFIYEDKLVVKREIKQDHNIKNVVILNTTDYDCFVRFEKEVKRIVKGIS